ncbi:MAG: YceI family protein, partial [Ferruginibacter sp.]
FPKASYKGQITDISKVNLSKDGNYSVATTGELTMHGVTQKINSPGTIVIKAGKISANADFSVLLADYKITVPKLAENNISKSIDIKINVALDQKM